MSEVGLQPHTQAEHLHWKYWQDRADWPNARSFVVMEGTELLAHAAVVPTRCQWGSRHLTFIHLVDWAARPDAAGVGLFLLKKMVGLGDALLALSFSSQASQVMPLTGFKSYGTLTQFRRPIHPLAYLKGSWKPLWKVPARVVRGAIWTATAPRPTASGWKERRIAPEDLTNALAQLARRKSGVTAFDRNEELLRHMLGCPIARMELYLLEKQGRAAGYYLLGHISNEVRLADCWMQSEDSADWRGLVVSAVNQAKRSPGAAELTAWSSEPRLSRALEECGFRPGVTGPILVRAKTQLPDPQFALHVQMLECDAAYY